MRKLTLASVSVATHPFHVVLDADGVSLVVRHRLHLFLEDLKVFALLDSRRLDWRVVFVGQHCLALGV